MDEYDVDMIELEFMEEDFPINPDEIYTQEFSEDTVYVRIPQKERVPKLPLPEELAQPDEPAEPLVGEIGNGKPIIINNEKKMEEILKYVWTNRERSMISRTNGLDRGYWPKYILAGTTHNGELVLAVQFRSGKHPDIVCADEMRDYAPYMMIDYYVNHLEFMHKAAQIYVEK